MLNVVRSVDSGRDDRDLSTLFAGLDDAPALVLAVSGGPDSMALMHLAQRWRETRTHGPALHVATVDHGLRPEAGREARLVAREADLRTLPHAILPWIGPKPVAGLQEKARQARYCLLVEHARELGAPFVLTAHHADDQAETVLMRLGRGSGVTGLCAMRRLTVIGDGVTLVRPLLESSKSDLLAICIDRGLEFASDPSNENLMFRRVYLRSQVGAAAALGLDRRALQRLARRMARAEQALEAECTRVETLVQPVRALGRWTADLAPARGSAPEVLQRLLARAIADVAGPGPIPLERLERLADALGSALADHRSFRGTLGGTLLALDATACLDLQPEPPRRRGRHAPIKAELTRSVRLTWQG